MKFLRDFNRFHNSLKFKVVHKFQDDCTAWNTRRFSVEICDSTRDISQYGNVIYTEQIESRNKWPQTFSGRYLQSETLVFNWSEGNRRSSLFHRPENSVWRTEKSPRQNHPFAFWGPIYSIVASAEGLSSTGGDTDCSG